MWTNIYPSLTSAHDRNLDGGSGRQRNSDGLHYHKFNSEIHIRPDCPRLRNRGDDGGRVSEDQQPETNCTSNFNSNPNYNSSSNSNSNSTGKLASASIWGYIYPDEKYQVIEVNGFTFKFCAKC